MPNKVGIFELNQQKHFKPYSVGWSGGPSGDFYTNKSFRQVTNASATVKRQKPSLLLPRYGTPRNTTYYIFQMESYGRKRPFVDSSGRTSWNYIAGDVYQQAGWDALWSESLNKIQRPYGYLDADKAIQNRIISEILSAKSQAAVDLIEFRKTKDMFAAAGMDLFNFLRGLRSGRSFANLFLDLARPVTRGSKKLSNRWLEFQYGWAPTVSGAFETADALSTSWQSGVTYTNKVRVPTSHTGFVTFTDSKKNLVSVNQETRSRAYYQYDMIDPDLYRFSQLGFTNPLSIAWEVVPFSFVLDWFVDVGGYINRMDWALGLKNIHYQTYITQTSNRLISIRWDERNNKACDSYGSLLSRKVDITRSGPRTKLENSFRGLKPFTNESVRLTSALALFWQSFTRNAVFR